METEPSEITDQQPVTNSQPSEVKPKTSQHHRTTIPLGPCQVCGANSSGYHFGVISCEACKSFFRRTIKLKLEYSCLHSKDTESPLRQIKGEKPPCPACRFSKCLKLGMAVQAIKRGRYSHAKRVETFHSAQKLSQPILCEVKQEPELSPCQGENNEGTGGENQSVGEHYGSNAVFTVTSSSQSKQQGNHPSCQPVAQTSTSSKTFPEFSHGNSTTFQENYPVNRQHPLDVNIAEAEFQNFPEKTNTGSPHDGFLPPPSQYAVVQPPLAHQHHIDRNISRLSEYSETELHIQVSLSGNVNATNAEFTNQPLNLATSSTDTNRRRDETGGDGDTCSRGGSNVQNKPARSRYGILPEYRDIVLLLDARDQQNTGSSDTPAETSRSVQEVISSKIYQQAAHSLGNLDKGNQDKNGRRSPWNSRLLPVSLLSDVGRDSDMDTVVDIIVNAYDAQNFIPYGFTAKIPALVHKYLISKQKQLYPKPEQMSREEHRRIYRETGEDADGRLMYCVKMGYIFEYLIKKVSTFLLQLPGFKSLHPDDRCAIVKCRGWMLIIPYLLYVALPDPGDYLIFTEMNNKTEIVPSDMMMLVYSEEVTKKSYELKHRWTELDLTYKEDALFLAILTVCEHEKISEEGKLKCAAMKATFMLCLRQILSRRLPEEGVNKLLSTITTLLDDLLRQSVLVVSEGEELGIYYAKFLAEQTKLLYEIVS